MMAIILLLAGCNDYSLELSEDISEDIEDLSSIEKPILKKPAPEKPIHEKKSKAPAKPKPVSQVPPTVPEQVIPEPEEVPAIVPEDAVKDEPEEIQAPSSVPQQAIYNFQLPPANGNEYYVSANGNNANPGTKSQPWATPGYGSRQLQPGDTLILLGGRYILSEYDADIVTPNSGTKDNWVVIKGEAGNRPVLAGRNNLLSGFNIADAHYVWIDNIELASDNGALFRDGIAGMSGLVSNVILSNLYIHNVDEFGINIADTDNLKILNSQITYTGFGAVGGPEGQQGGWRNVLIRGSSLSYGGHYYQGGPGPSIYDRPDGFGIEPSDGPIEIADTIAEHNRGDGFDSKARNTYIHDCIVSNNFADGIKLWGTGSKVENCLVYGKGDGNPMSTPWASVVIDTTDNNAHFEFNSNTIDAEAGQSYLFALQYDFGENPVTLTMNNNIFSSRGSRVPIWLGRNVGYTAEGNVFWFPQTENFFEHNGVRNFGSGNIVELGAGNIYADPLFAKTGFGDDGDYHLQSGSPAKNAGKESLR